MTGSVHSAGLRVKVMLKKRPASSNVTVGAESVRLVQAALSGCWDVLRSGRASGSSLVAVAVFIRGGGQTRLCGLHRLRGFGLRCLRLGVGGLRGSFERRLAVERRPAEAAERQQRPAEHSETENDADRGHHPLRDGVDIAALPGPQACRSRPAPDSRASAQALAGIAAGGAVPPGLPQTLAGGGPFGPARGCLAAWAGFFGLFSAAGRARFGSGWAGAFWPPAVRPQSGHWLRRVIGRAAKYSAVLSSIRTSVVVPPAERRAAA